MENKIITRRRALEAALETVNYKIANLKPHYSVPQIRCWYKERQTICEQLRYLPTVEQVKQNAKSFTKLKNQILRR